MDHVLDILEISNLLDRPVTNLSGGERKESLWPGRYYRARNCFYWMNRWPPSMSG